MSRVFVTAKLPGDSVERLSSEHDVTVFEQDRQPTDDELIAGARDCDALITMVTDRVTGEIIGACPALRIISNCGVGYENIDVEAATRRGVLVTNTPGVLTEATADLAWSLILSAARRVVEADRFTREGRFTGWSPTLLLGVNVYGKTLGIFGMGRIGTAVAKRAKGFGMSVIYHNRNPNPDGEAETGARYVEFEALLRESDFLVVTAPLNEGTRGRFGAPEFSTMKADAVIVNVGRGQIIRERELARALRSGRIGGAGLDVFEREPEIEGALLELPNAVLLPHIGSASRETRQIMAEMSIESIEAALRGAIPNNLVNPAVLEGRPSGDR